MGFDRHEPKKQEKREDPMINPAGRTWYERWKQLAERMRLRCRFELSTLPEFTFPELLAAADADHGCCRRILQEELDQLLAEGLAR